LLIVSNSEDLTLNSLLMEELLTRYRAGVSTVREEITAVLAAIDAAPDRNVWITKLTREQVMAYVDALDGKAPESLPLYGVPFAIKDNIDLAEVPTTAACPDFAYVPQRSATVVQQLIDAGAIPIGKTNLDQFATGLVGTRSPFGACQNSFDREYVSGGSSSGSAVAVATGLVSFALGTDTAGSGRVPAGFNNLVGLKPTCGLLSTTGMLPACRSLDCVSIFALSANDAERVFKVARGYDVTDAYSRRPETLPLLSRPPGARVFGVPRREQLDFDGDSEYQRLFDLACERLIAMGWQSAEIDLQPFLDTARLLYDGPWIAERHAALGEFVSAHADSVWPVTRRIIEGGGKPTASELFRAQHTLADHKRATSTVWADIDLLLVPTAPTIYRIAEEQREPIARNSKLGTYTNFVNLLDLTAVAVPSGFRVDGMPFGVTFIAPAGSDSRLLNVASEYQYAAVATLGATSHAVPRPQLTPESGYINVVVCGAHMEGLPLNHQLQQRGARRISATRTSVDYRFFALPGGPPERPGLVRVRSGGGAIEVEVWSMPERYFGSFVAGIPAPLGIGKIELEDGTLHPGFICEGHAIESARDITVLGGWRRYLRESSAR
jgi:allophanate hydrolase